METYQISCWKNFANKNSRFRKYMENRLMLLSSCAIYGKKNQLLLKIENSTILMINLKWIRSLTIFLLAGDKFIPELHLIQPGFNYGACGPFTKQKERIYNFRETVNVKHLYRNELDKACFAHDAAYSDSKDLAKKIFQIRFQIIELMEMLEIGNMMISKSIIKYGI